MATLRAAILLACLVSVAGDSREPVDNSGKGSPKLQGLPVGAQVGIGLASAAGAAAAGTVFAIETDKKLKHETEEVAEDAVTNAKETFQDFPANANRAFEPAKKAFEPAKKALGEFPGEAKKAFQDFPGSAKKAFNELSWEHVTATITFDVQLPSNLALREFVQDPEVSRAAAQGLAAQLKIPPDWVSVQLSSNQANVAPQRRLSTKASVVMDIDIAVPLAEPNAHDTASKLSDKIMTVSKTDALNWLRRFLSPALAMRVALGAAITTTLTPFDSSFGSSGDSSASLNSHSLQSESSGSGLSGSSGFYASPYVWVSLLVLVCGSLSAYGLAQAGKPRRARTRPVKSVVPEAVEDVESAPAAAVEQAPLLPLQWPLQMPQLVPQLGMAPMPTTATTSYAPSPAVYNMVPTPAPMMQMNPGYTGYTASPPIVAQPTTSFAPQMATTSYSPPQMAAPAMVQRAGPGRRRAHSPMGTPPVPPPHMAQVLPAPVPLTGQQALVADAVFNAIDVNHDGAITRAELNQAVRSGIVGPGPGGAI